ncbi:MAG: hypothetical protein J0I06_25585 [Planctomycetes bacterium]|nr:hypothetical protein [Planctomycetota bacterium]
MAPPDRGDFTEGGDRPDPVARLIAFDFYDGALAGVLEVVSGRSYRYDFIDERPMRGDPNATRMFLLSPLPDGSFSRLVELISPHCSPSLPYWIPSWWHLGAAEKAALDAEVDAVPASAGPAVWVVAGDFLCDLRLRVRRALAEHNSADERAALFGLQ